MAFVSSDDLAVWMGTTFSSDDDERATALLDALEGDAVDIGDSTWTDTTVPARVQTIIKNAARRAFANPDGFTSETIGSYTYRREAAGVVGTGFFTPFEVRVLRRLGGRVGIDSLEMVRHYNNGTSDNVFYAPVQDSNEPVPLWQE